MNVRDLMSYLEDFDGDTEVRLATQPNWPFESTIDTVAAPEGTTHCEECEVAWAVHGEHGCDAEQGDEDELKNVVYIGEGSQIGYLPGAARNALGWA